MKIAYLITAYKDPHHLKRLIGSLSTPNTRFYVHIDAKVRQDAFSGIIRFKNVKFIDRRYVIHWGDYSQVQSISALLDAVLRDKRQPTDRVVLISGQDYPLKSNSEIVEIFEQNPQKLFLTGFNITKAGGNQARKVRNFHFQNYPRYLKFGVNRLFRLLPIRKRSQIFFNGGMHDVYMGSDYWSMTYEATAYLHETWCREDHLREYFRRSFVPSEMFAHTIIFNSSYSRYAEVYRSNEYRGLHELTPLHQLEYTSQIKLFTERDYDVLVKSPKMFFRKATTLDSGKLLDKIDEHRAANNRGLPIVAESPG